MSEFVQRIHGIYDRGTPAIHPFIGDAFVNPKPPDLRILGVGINAYSAGDDWGKQPPDLYAQWFQSQRYRYQKGVWRDLQALAGALTAPPYLFAGKTLMAMESIFLTNAVKVFMREVDGKRADQLSDEHFTAHLDQWHDELDVMAEFNALPHVIAIIGDPFWKFACSSFGGAGAFKQVHVASYRSVTGPCLHFVNRITVATAHGPHDVLLVRLRHPAGRTLTGSPRWLVEQPAFREIAATGPSQGVA